MPTALYPLYEPTRASVLSSHCRQSLVRPLPYRVAAITGFAPQLLHCFAIPCQVSPHSKADHVWRALRSQTPSQAAYERLSYPLTKVLILFSYVLCHVSVRKYSAMCLSKILLPCVRPSLLPCVRPVAFCRVSASSFERERGGSIRKLVRESLRPAFRSRVHPRSDN